MLSIKTVIRRFNKHITTDTMGSCMSCSNTKCVVEVSRNPVFVRHSKEADDLIQQITDELVLDFMTKMPQVPQKRVVIR